MSLIVLLDAGPLGMITNPKSSPENEECKDWLARLAYSGAGIVFRKLWTMKCVASCSGQVRKEGSAAWTR